MNNKKVTLKALCTQPPILLCFLTKSEANVGGIKVEVEPSQYLFFVVLEIAAEQTSREMSCRWCRKKHTRKYSTMLNERLQSVP